MKYDVMFLVVRLNGKIESITPIEESYTDCQISLDDTYLTDDDIKKFYEDYCGHCSQEDIDKVRKNHSLYKESEAMFLTCELSQYSVKIEHKEIDFE